MAYPEIVALVIGQDNDDLVIFPESSNKSRHIAAPSAMISWYLGQTFGEPKNKSQSKAYLRASSIASSFSIRAGLLVANTFLSATGLSYRFLCIRSGRRIDALPDQYRLL